MSEIQNNTCPGCGRHCDLNAPHCPRGEEFARTGMLPQDENGSHRHEQHGEGPHSHSHGHGPHGPMRGREHDGPPHRGPHHFEDEQNYSQLSEDEKIMAQLRKLGFISRFGMGGKGGQGRVVSVLAQYGPMTQRQLTEKLGIQSASASEIIGKAERAGLVTRRESAQDRRTIDVALTEAGETAAKKESVPPLQCLSEEEKHQLLPLLEKLSSAWQENRPPMHGER